jgi:6-phosphogluconolactonase
MCFTQNSDWNKMAQWLFPSVLTVLAAAILARAAPPAKYLVYIGTYTDHGSEGIYVCEFDPASGRLTAPKLAAQAAEPSFLAIAPSRRFLYAVNEFDRFHDQPTGALTAFSIDSATGKLAVLNQVPSRDSGPAFITLDRSGRYLLVANYTFGSVAVFAVLPDGRIGESTAFVRHQGSSMNPQRQAGPHAHAIVMALDNRFAMVADLGLDRLLVYPFDASRGTLGQAHTIKAEPGVGPRHLVLAASGKMVYVINELSSTVTIFSYHSSDGAMVPIQTVSLLPTQFAGESAAAELVLTPSGRFLYGSNRGDDSIAVFGVDPKTGTLTVIQLVPTGGKTPRSFAVDPSGEWLLAANQDSNSVVTFRINRESGCLTPAGQSIEVNSPAMIDFIPRDGGK